jgi:TetR/AcrR family transcriptional regulator
MNESAPEVAQAGSGRQQRGDGGRRERLLEMATREFAAKGLAGARVDAIARAARSNKQLVYYYFGNKIGLYNEVVGRIGPMVHGELFPEVDESETLAQRVHRRATHTWGPLAQRWSRLLGWEALERGDRDILREQERFNNWRHRKREIEAAQDRGEVDRRFDPELLGLALLAVELMPRVLPQLTKIVTGLRQSDPEFQARQEALLAELVAHLRGADGGRAAVDDAAS